MDGDAQVKDKIMEHRRASEQRDSAAEHAIDATDAILDYPQSGERFRGPRQPRDPVLCRPLRPAAVAGSAGRADAGPLGLTPTTEGVIKPMMSPCCATA